MSKKNYYHNETMKHHLLVGWCFMMLLLIIIIFFATGEGKLISTDGSVYEGSFHNHRRHGEGKFMLRYILEA